MRRTGFSLIELSIVLAIIGLIVGGIVAGQGMARASALKGAATDIQKFRTSIENFRSQYNGWPGDMINATNYWGTAAGSGSDTTCYNVFKTTEATCNGNGDGSLYGGTVSLGTHIYVERFLAWQHLANAGLIDGHYTGRTDDNNTYTPAPGRNMPPSKLSTTGFYDFYTISSVTADPFQFPDSFHAGMQLTLYGAASEGVSAGVLTPEELFQIDSKFDDGKPGYGKIRHPKKTSAVGPNCVTTDLASTAIYDLDNKNVACIIHWFF